MPMDFTPFLAAQERNFATAMSELRRGRKRSHWIWFVLPILAGLRESPTAIRFAMPDLPAAREYLQHPLLGARLCDTVDIVHEQVCVRSVSIRELMGSEVDAHKLVSSLTLFVAVAEALGASFPSFIAQGRALLAAAAMEGVPPCRFTEDVLTRAM